MFKMFETGGKVAALEALQAKVMMADAKLNITFMNAALTTPLAEAEADLKKELPRFSMATLIGSIFIGDGVRESQDYASFWSRLRGGEYQAGEFRRFGKGGREVWI